MLLFWVQTLLYLLTADKGGYQCISSHLISNQREYLIISDLNSFKNRASNLGVYKQYQFN